ncbi:hypothetical protein [Agrobacterium tumefaciens]|uniref:hypothetical protein n=1 Tax=Agrobacterium tumefaciens TaxID=358 RepID=UPI00287F1F76|nr:hypothetical protein [Agrobacterium tumefaciens]MDS7593914.1 hypothetical protein [Agrobacterium tumefaciens]
MERELTLSEILTDPLIHVMLKADNISVSDFSDIIRRACERLAETTFAPLPDATKPHQTAPLDIVQPGSSGRHHFSSRDLTPTFA